jgi:putative phosphoesterase
MTEKNRPAGERHQIGILSDTHGNLREDALDALQGSDLIIHAGDVGKRDILEALEAIAPVVAVRGNMDREAWTNQLPLSQGIQLGEISIYVLHDLLSLDLDPKTAGFDLIVSGHTHEPDVREIDGVLFLNPGSAGSHRFGKQLSLAKVQLSGEKIGSEIVFLDG